MSVLPDVAKVDRVFDYLLPPGVHDRAGSVPIVVGTMVRIDLHGRRVDGWIVGLDQPPETDAELKTVAAVVGVGPDPAMVGLCRWAAYRWAGLWATFLRTASPERRVAALPSVVEPRPPRVDVSVTRITEGHLEVPVEVVRLPPAEDPFPWLAAACARGQALIVCASVTSADRLARRVAAAGVPVARHPEGWARAAAGATVVGTRAAAFAPAPHLAAVVVVDEHDEALGGEGAPTWHARDVAIERGRRAGVPVVLLSPVPSLEALAAGPLVVADRAVERAGWPRLEIVDRRGDDPRLGLWSEALVARARATLAAGARVVVVLNRTGRAALVACGSCGAVASCERCAAAVRQQESGVLQCARCGHARPMICDRCGATRLKLLRIGVDRAAEELEAVLALGGTGHVHVVTGASADAPEVRTSPVVVGTEAVLHRVGGGVGLVCFAEVDQELLAPRYRAAEEALGLLARAARLVRGRSGRLLVQTRLPDHPVLDAVLHADPGRVVEVERARRDLVGMPPATTIAVVGGAAAPAFMARLDLPEEVEVVGPSDGEWLLRAEDPTPLLDALAAVPRPAGRLKLQLNPLRLR